MYSFVKCGCSIYFFLSFANLICRSTDISKYFRGCLGLRDNGIDCIPKYLNQFLIERTPPQYTVNLDDSNTDSSFTLDKSNSFLSAYEILQVAREKIYFENFLILSLNFMLYVLIRIASKRRF